LAASSMSGRFAGRIGLRHSAMGSPHRRPGGLPGLAVCRRMARGGSGNLRRNQRRETQDQQTQEFVGHRPEHKRGPWRIESISSLQEASPSSEYPSRYAHVR
jgi:hypothetical protein